MFAVRRQESIRILLIEEEILVRAALSQLVTSFGFEIVGEAGSAQQAATELSRIKPDVVLLSLNGTEGIDLKFASLALGGSQKSVGQNGRHGSVPSRFEVSAY